MLCLFMLNYFEFVHLHRLFCSTDDSGFARLIIQDCTRVHWFDSFNVGFQVAIFLLGRSFIPSRFLFLMSSDDLTCLRKV